MKLTDMLKTGWNYTKKVAKPVGIFIAGTYIILNTYSCDKNDPVDKVTIDNEIPVEGTYTDKKVGDKQLFKFDSNSSLGLPLEEFYRVDGVRVDNDSTHS